MSAEHPFYVGVQTEDHPDGGPKGNAAYYAWLERTIVAAQGGKPVPWIAVELGILLDRIIRAHEAESTGGPMCDECSAWFEEDAK